MEVTLKCKLLNLKAIRIKRGENAGKYFYIGDFYDGNNLYKISVPEENKKEIEPYVGKELVIKVYVKLESAKLYFKDIA